MNASFWDAAVARKLRVDLLLEHLGKDTSAQTDREAFARYREIAQANRTRRANGEPMKGQVFTTDPSRWATEDD